MSEATTVTLPAPAAAETRRSPRRAFLILGIVGAVLVGGIGLYAVVTANAESTDDAQVAADVVPIAPRVQGLVRRVAVAENQHVKKGELLVQLDDLDYQAKVKKAEAEVATAEAQAVAADAQVQVVEASSKGGLASARAAYSGSSVGVASAEAQIAAARANLIRSQADVRKKDIDLERARELRKVNAVPQQNLDNATAADDEAHAALNQAQAQVAAAEEQKHAAQAHVSEMQGALEQSTPINARIAAARANAQLAHASVQSAHASLDLAKLDLSYTTITAPADGMAASLTVREGMLVMPGQMLTRLVPTTTYLVANFKETQVGRMKAGDAAEIEIDAFPHKKFEGRVESLSGGTGGSFALIPADNASGNFVKVVQRVPVRISWLNLGPEVQMRSGLSADVTVRVGH
jgi:membrane fusion protein, multidrug efflux system